MAWFRDLGVQWKLLACIGIVVVLIGGAASWTAYQLQQQDASYTRLVNGEANGAALAQEMRAGLLLQVQALKNTWLRGEDPKKFEQYAAEFDARAADLRVLRSKLGALDLQLTPDERELLRQFDTGWADYLGAWPLAKNAYGGPGGGRPNDADAVMNGKDRQPVAALDALAEDLVVRRDAAHGALRADASQIRMEVGLLLGIATMLGLGVALLLARSIAGSVTKVAAVAEQVAQFDVPSFVAVAQAFARGDLTQAVVVTAEPVNVQGQDEIGTMAAAFNRIINGIHETGTAFEEMGVYLRDAIGEVSVSANTLAGTSGHLGDAAGQASGVVQQVSQAVQNVAAGAQETSRSAHMTNVSVGQLGQAIDGIAMGATDQARQIQAVSATATQMAAGVEQVANNAHRVATASQQTRASAENGRRAVLETVEGMSEIKLVVATAAAKVDELGRLGDKIGAVVETIDDIAEQTNLLALNAAIEAARAGEHGKGFAVVADEVRKLAERSQRETKAIAGLIHEVQDGTRDAVTAMEHGSVKVDEGSARADEAGQALTEILEAVESTVAQVSQIATAAGDMANGARGVVDAMSSISAVVEQNTAATEEMAAQAEQVTASIASIAAVSEENSAATEEVSASAEEMSAQVEEMSAQAEELAATADQLRLLVARFHLGESDALTVTPVTRRRADDRGPARPSTSTLRAV